MKYNIKRQKVFMISALTAILVVVPLFSPELSLIITCGDAFAGTADAAVSGIKLEADQLNIVRCTSGETSVARFAEDGFAARGAFTDDLTLYWHNAENSGAILELGFQVEKKGSYGLVLQMGKYRTFGRFQFMANGKPAGAPVDLFGFPEKDEIVPFSVDLGEVILNQGDNLLALKLVGTNPETVMADHGACIDWIELTLKGAAITTGSGSETVIATETTEAVVTDKPDTTEEAVETTGTVVTETPTTEVADETTETVETTTTVETDTSGKPDIPAVPTGTGEPIEADTLDILSCSSGEVIPRKLAEDGYANENDFTGNVSLQWHDAAEPGAVLELALPAVTKGRYVIEVRVAMYRTYGIHQFLINKKAIGKPVDMFGNPGHDIVTPFTVNLGEADLAEGVNTLGIRLTGTNPDTIMANHGAGLDWIKLTPVKRIDKK